MKNNNLPTAVVLGMSATGLSVARSLGRKGIKVYGLDWSDKEPCAYSRYVESYTAPNVIETEEEFVDYLINFGKKLAKRTPLFCAHDEYVAAVSRHRQRLEPYFIFNIPSEEVVENFLDKRRSYDIARQCGISCPTTYFTEDVAEVEKISRTIKYPCALKPAISHLWRTRIGWKKLIPANSPDELLTQFKEIKKIYPQIMIQELIPGDDDQIYLYYAYYNKQREPVAYFIPRKIRQNPIHFGVGSFNVSEMNQQVKEIGMRLLSKINYTGMGAPEIKRDSKTGEYKFMELNMRFIMIGELAIASGVDLPYIMYKDLMGEKIEQISIFNENVGLLNFELDIESFWNYRKSNEITLLKYLKSFIGKKKIAFTYFALDDLRPFLFIYGKFFSRVLKFIMNKLKSVFVIVPKGVVQSEVQ